MIQATEAFFRHQVGQDCRFIFRPRWTYNYSIEGDLVGFYRSLLSQLKDWFPLAKWSREIGSLGKQRIYCISFPQVERTNVLMHVNWGHELGHILADEWAQNHFAELWIKAEPAIRDRISRHHLGDIRRSRAKQAKLLVVADDLARTLEFTKKALRELISDHVGVHLFGPASLCALFDFSSRFELDAGPSTIDGYPPWRMRLRRIGEVLHSDINGAEALGKSAALFKGLRAIQDLNAEMTDLRSIEADIASREAYVFVDRHLKSVATKIIGKLPRRTQKPYRLRSRLRVIEELVERLEQELPPNETGTWPKTCVPELADIWNAAWVFVYYKQAKDEKWGSSDELDEIHSLVLKAIESMYVHDRYKPKLRSK